MNETKKYAKQKRRIFSWVNKSQVACNQAENFISVFFRFFLEEILVLHMVFVLWFMREHLTCSQFNDLFFDLQKRLFLIQEHSNETTIKYKPPRLVGRVHCSSSLSSSLHSQKKFHLTLFNLRRFSWQRANRSREWTCNNDSWA